MSGSLRTDMDVPVEMRDGTVLRVDIARPDDNEKHPAILSRAYQKGYAMRLGTQEFIDAGYALISGVIRGRGTSGGEWKAENTFNVEGPDGYDTIEWIAAQSWCDGNVGMMGGSHATCFQYMAAIENPPHLKAIAPFTGDFQTHFVPPHTGGAISLLTALVWLPNESEDVVNRLEKSGQDITEMRQVLSWARNNPEEFYNFLPLKDVPPARFERMHEMWAMRLHPVKGSELEKYRQYDKVMVPCFHECGWYDACGWTEFENFINLHEQGGSQLARENQYIICGPWPHGPSTGTLGNINWGVSASVEGAHLTEQQLAFYDRYLRGKDIDIPFVKYFVMGRNQWQTADTWPLPQTQWQRFYIHSKGSANTAAGNGLLSRDEPVSEPPDRFIYDPHRPVPTVGGALIGSLEGVGIIAGPIEQSCIERRDDVLCYTTAEFREDVEITGPLILHLFASTSVRDTDFTAKVVDVYPDGGAYNLAEGIKRASGRKSQDKPEMVNPGEVYEYIIIIGNTSQLFCRGHRLRIDISSSNFPQFDRNMNTGNPIGEDTYGIPAMQTIYHQPGYASYIDLPVIPRNKNGV
ncbi:CocE/NonD family hydrolase [Chloroflexota bacterium]